MKLSIITINYNNSEGLAKTIKSVVSQSFSDFEYIIIDGGSTDSSKDIILQYKDNLAFWCSERDKGIYNAMNKGVHHSKGNYLLFLNSGDWLHDKNVIENIAPYLVNDIVYGDLVFSDKGKELDTFCYPDTLDLFYFLERSLGHPSTFIRRDLLVRWPYREDLKIVSDYEFFLKAIVINNASTRHIKQPVSVFDLTGISSTQKDEARREFLSVQNEVFPKMILQELRKLAKIRRRFLYRFLFK